MTEQPPQSLMPQSSHDRAADDLPSQSPAQQSWRRFRRHKPAVIGGIYLLVLVGAMLVALPWTLQNYDKQQLALSRTPPSLHHPFGFDILGRDMLHRCLFGGLISFSVGIGAALVSVTVGVLWGAISALAGGRVDNVMMRLVDILYGLPYILLVILMKVAFESPLAQLLGGDRQMANIVILFLAIGSVSWLTMSRVVRGQVLSLREMPFVEAARAAGVGPMGVLVRHLLPNLVGPIVVYATLTIPQAILQESFLSFLGIGVAPPIPTWGSLAADGVAAINTVVSFWWMLFYPCLLLGTTLLALNFVGDGLRDALDPRER
ncbi:MAG: ABC transporter permease [Phycisphaerae bacterium]|nr:ABC transporter permease [Phycisphaerae bacterium]